MWLNNYVDKVNKQELENVKWKKKKVVVDLKQAEKVVCSTSQD